MNCLPQARHCCIFSLHYYWGRRGLINCTPSFLHLSSEAVERQTQGTDRWRWKYQLYDFWSCWRMRCRCSHVYLQTQPNLFQIAGPSHGGKKWDCRIFREETEEGASLQAQLNLIILHDQQNCLQVGKISEEMSGITLLEIPPHRHVKRREESTPANKSL